MNAKLNDILQKKGVIPALVGVASFSAGIAVGYILGKRNGDVFMLDPEAVYPINESDDVEYTPTRPLPVGLEALLIEEEQAHNAEQERLREAYLAEKAEQEAAVILEADREEVEDESESDISVNTVAYNVFGSRTPRWDYDAEVAKRTKTEPYILHQDEFMADEMDFHQETVTYYKKDDIVSDAENSPIYNYRELMGELDFGHGSNDPNVVYIRNEKIHMEWEVLLDTGSFAEEVLGLEFERETERELRHSIQKFRPTE